jgi:hypothetical protein
MGLNMTMTIAQAQDEPTVVGSGIKVIGPGARAIIPKPKEETLPSESFSSIFAKDEVPCRFEVSPSWQGPDRCGLNCLFAMLNLTGRAVSYNKLSEQAGPIPKGGLSAEQMMRLAEHFGLKCMLLKGDITELDSLKPPAIVHIGDLDRPGHFICYYSHSGDALLFIDGTSGGTFTAGNMQGRSLESLARKSSGYMIVPSIEEEQRRGISPSILNPLALVMSLLSAILWLVVGIRYYLARRNGKGQHPSDHAYM